ncbi:MAG: carbon storage regulator [Gammaproteobacteria bacterium]|nr:carbon storage regulator [Gammaproteobacteria bacterium]
MDIVTINFEEPLILSVNNEAVRVVAFKTQEHGHIKFGVDAPRSIKVHREEVYLAIKKQEEEGSLV